jgi:3D (Asp-Asp-Asp) domain-containing protein
VRWEISNDPVTGASGLPLVAFKSLAVDPQVIPYKSVVYIPEAKNVLYRDADGKVQFHDGYFLAADTGSLIKGDHIDVFIGTADQNPFAFVQSKASSSFDAYIVQDEQRRQELLNLHLSAR